MHAVFFASKVVMRQPEYLCACVQNNFKGYEQILIIFSENVGNDNFGDVPPSRGFLTFLRSMPRGILRVKYGGNELPGRVLRSLNFFFPSCFNSLETLQRKKKYNHATPIGSPKSSG